MSEQQDWRINVRSHFELAESCHPGKMRAYARMLREYLESVESLIGTDEHRCEVCGKQNYDADGNALPVFMCGHGEKFWCEDHHAEFVASFDSPATARTEE